MTSEVAFEVRAITEEEREEFLQVSSVAFGNSSLAISDKNLKRFQQRASIDRSVAAFDQGKMIATSFNVPLSLSLPGNSNADIAWMAGVGTLSSHRRKGVMKAILHCQLNSLKKEGFAFVGLATNLPVYRKFQFGATTAHYDLTFGEKRQLRSAYSWDGHIEFTDDYKVDELIALHERCRNNKIGEISRDPAWWAHDCRLGMMHIYLRSSSGELQGWAAYRVTDEGWSISHSSKADVQYMLAANNEARRSLWHTVLGLDFARAVTVRTVPTDDIVFQLLVNPMDATVTRIENPHMRILNVEAALLSRMYEGGFEANIDVTDPIFESNNGVFNFTVAEDGKPVSCERVTQKAELSLDVTDLPALLTGHASLNTLINAGLASSINQATTEKVNNAFRTTSAPYCSLMIV